MTITERLIFIADARRLKPTPRLDALLGQLDAQSEVITQQGLSMRNMSDEIRRLNAILAKAY